jgi:hypothetical protein
MSPIDFTIENYPRGDALKHPNAFLAATSVAWALHGLAAWSSGEHIMSEQTRMENTPTLSTKIAINNHLKNIVRIARGPQGAPTSSTGESAELD